MVESPLVQCAALHRITSLFVWDPEFLKQLGEENKRQQQKQVKTKPSFHPASVYGEGGSEFLQVDDNDDRSCRRRREMACGRDRRPPTERLLHASSYGKYFSNHL